MRIFAFTFIAAVASLALAAPQAPATPITPIAPWPTQAYIPTLSAADWAALRSSILNIIRQDLAGPGFIRLAYHDAGSYSVQDGSGGPHASLAYTTIFNANILHRGIQTSIARLDPLVATYAGRLSRADIWSFAGAVAATHLFEPPSNGGPPPFFIRWRPGRVDLALTSQSDIQAIATTIAARLPAPEDSFIAIFDKFARMGLSTNQAVVLIGAHTLGRCQFENSGYRGTWSSNPHRLSNTFFNNLFTSTFNPVATPFQLTPTTPTTIKFQFNDTASRFIMIPSDMILKTNTIVSPLARQYVSVPGSTPQTDTAAFTFQRDFAAAFSALLEIGVKDFLDAVSAPVIDTVGVWPDANGPMPNPIEPASPPSEADLITSSNILSDPLLSRFYPK